MVTASTHLSSMAERKPVGSRELSHSRHIIIDLLGISALNQGRETVPPRCPWDSDIDVNAKNAM